MRIRALIMIVAITAIAAITVVPVAGAQQFGKAPAETEKIVITSGYAIHHDTSLPLREMALTAPLPTGLSAEVPIRIKPGTGEKTPPEGIVDENVQTDARPFFDAAPTPPVDVTVSALSDDDNAVVVGTRIVPPDTNGDIGFDGSGNRIYVQYINLIWAVYSDTGALLNGPFAGNTFWTGFGGPCQSNNNGDPVVLYDDDAGRWVFSQFSINQGIQCVAVSTTSDPLGPYHRYAFTVTPGGANDYPKMGVWAEGSPASQPLGVSTSQSAYTFTTRDFGGAGGSFSVGAGVMERDAMLVGASAQFTKFSNPCTGANCIEGQLPPHQAGPPPPFGTCPTFFTFVDDSYDDSPFATDGVRNHTLCVDWNSLGSSTYVENAFVSGANFDRFLGNGFSDCISPVFGGEVLDCLSLFTMYRAQYRWFDNFASVVINTTVDANGANSAGIHWGEVRSADGQSGWSIFQEGTYAPADGIERWMGSIAQDGDQNIALGYSATSSSLRPSVRYTTRQVGDAPGTLPGGEEVCHNGTGSQTASANRWGDYSSMSVDPSDDCTFWFTQEYYETTGSFDFNTRICSFKLADCGGGVERVLPESFTAQGTLLSGTLDDLLASDDNRVVIRSAPMLGGADDPAVSITVEGITTLPSPTELRFTYEGQTTVPGVSQRIYLFDFAANDFVLVGDQPATSGDSTATVVIDSNVGDFVGAGGLLRARIGLVPSGPGFSRVWVQRVDLTVWDVTP